MRVQGIGVGVPEYVSPAGELTSREVMDWDIQPSELFGTLGPVWIESDVRCGALAEARQGAGRELDSFMYVTVGTGLSSTLVVRGAPWMGHRGEAIALGELPVDSFLDVSRINLESFCSGAGMAIRYEALTGQAPEAHLANEAASGDTAAHEVLVSGARALGRALAATAKIVDPAAFVLGGGLGTSRGLWQGELYREYEAAVGPRPGAPPLIQATLGEDSGAIGAALLPLARSS
jgi:glucokinase